jgi:HSP20 family protein
MTLTKFSNNDYPSFPSFFDRFFDRNLMDWTNTNFSSTNSTLPSVNVRENDDEFLIEVAAPGLKKDDFNVSYDNGKLTISSEFKDESSENKGDYYRKEFSYQSFQRTFTIADNIVNGEKIAAKYIDGILHINLPKRDEVKPKPTREIKIS